MYMRKKHMDHIYTELFLNSSENPTVSKYIQYVGLTYRESVVYFYLTCCFHKKLSTALGVCV